MSLRMLWRCNLKLVSSQTAQLRLHLCLGRSLNSMGRAKANLLILNSVTRSLSSNSTPYWVKGPIRTELYQTTTGEGLLNLSTKYKLSDKDMLILLSCLCRHKNTLKADFLRDPRLLAILQSLKNFGQTGSRGITAGDGVFTLRSLLHLGVSPSADVIVAYQQFIIRTINFLPVDSVALLAIFHRRFATSTPLSGDLQKQLEKFVVKNSKSLKDVSLLLPLVSEDLERLRLFEPLLLESLPQMKTVDLCRLLAAVGTLNYDSDVLVNNLTEVLCESTEVIPLKKVCACLQACERISCSPKLLERLLR